MRLCKEVGDILAPAVVHVAGVVQLAHGRIHERQPRAAGAPARKGGGVGGRPGLWGVLAVQPPWSPQLLAGLERGKDEEVPARGVPPLARSSNQSRKHIKVPGAAAATRDCHTLVDVWPRLICRCMASVAAPSSASSAGPGSAPAPTTSGPARFLGPTEPWLSPSSRFPPPTALSLLRGAGPELLLPGPLCLPAPAPSSTCAVPPALLAAAASPLRAQLLPVPPPAARCRCSASAACTARGDRQPMARYALSLALASRSMLAVMRRSRNAWPDSRAVTLFPGIQTLSARSRRQAYLDWCCARRTARARIGALRESIGMSCAGRWISPSSRNRAAAARAGVPAEEAAQALHAGELAAAQARYSAAPVRAPWRITA